MSILLGFSILLILMTLAYMVYRLYIRRNWHVLVCLSIQVFAATLAVVSFFKRVQINWLTEVFIILFGICIPGFYFIYDFFRMMKKVKETGIYDGVLEEEKKYSEEEWHSDLSRKFINPIQKEKTVSELFQEFNINQENILKDLKKSMSQAQVYINGGNFETAFDIYNAAAKITKSSPRLLYNLGNLAYRLGNFTEAVQSYKRVLETNERLAADKRAEKEVMLAEIMPKDYEPDFLDIEKFRYDEFMVYYNLGNAQFKLNRFEQSIHSYQKALEINPGLEEAAENIVRAYICMGREKEAIDYMENIISNSPRNHRAHFMMGSIFHAMKKYDQAIEELKKCIKINSDFLEGLELLANTLSKVEKYKEAADFYKKIIKLHPQDHKAYYHLGICLYHAGRKEDAANNYRQAAALKPDFYSAHYNLAVALDEMGTQEEAIAEYKKVIELKPDFYDAYNNLGVLLTTMKRRLEALDIFIRGLSKNPEEYSLYFNMGITLSEMGRYSEAVEAYKNALEIKPDLKEIRDRLNDAASKIAKKHLVTG